MIAVDGVSLLGKVVSLFELGFSGAGYCVGDRRGRVLCGLQAGDFQGVPSSSDDHSKSVSSTDKLRVHAPCSYCIDVVKIKLVWSLTIPPDFGKLRLFTT